ncbi:MAG: PEP-CTERM sorting domain-containing protein [Gammaproteobacteria bacterium]|nr:PEP-CTERM sorting domain-containing protein [Gammaproteobacteria bacterium]
MYLRKKLMKAIFQALTLVGALYATSAFAFFDNGTNGTADFPAYGGTLDFAFDPVSWAIDLEDQSLPSSVVNYDDNQISWTGLVLARASNPYSANSNPFPSATYSTTPESFVLEVEFIFQDVTAGSNEVGSTMHNGELVYYVRDTALMSARMTYQGLYDSQSGTYTPYDLLTTNGSFTGGAISNYNNGDESICSPNNPCDFNMAFSNVYSVDLDGYRYGNLDGGYALVLRDIAGQGLDVKSVLCHGGDWEAVVDPNACDVHTMTVAMGSTIVDITDVPEPETLLLFVSGLAGLGISAVRRRKLVA